ncbi:MAG: hypothetical protein JO257_06570 [Deltaproteobacteria bacterium]|nr:hypothetical protein [Deltaproteobacteria bacterium]
MRLSVVVLLAACGRIDFDGTAPTVGSTEARASIAAGDGFSCALRDGAVWCWGRDDAHQLARADGTLQPRPVTVTLPARTTKLAAGGANACAIDEAGGLWCWGDNSSGQLATGDQQPRETAVAIALPAPVTAVSIRAGHACAVAAGDAYCWGYNGDAECGVDPTTATYVTAPARVGPAVDVGIQLTRACAQRADGSVWCWGDHIVQPAQVPGVTALALATGYRHACALVEGGRYQCFGDNDEGDFGTGDNTSTGVQPPSQLGGLVAIFAGMFTTCAIDGAGQRYCWGNGNDGEQGDGTRYDHNAPVLDDTDAAAIALGDAHGCALRTSGQIDCWGYGSYGELGDGRLAALQPRLVPLPGPANFIAAGYQHACALVNGVTLCWGSNDAGELGVRNDLDPQYSSVTPVQVPIQSAGFVTAGDGQTCALVGSDFWCWGRNEFGQAGSPPVEYAHAPTMVTGLPSSNGAGCAGQRFACTYNTSGLACWGADDYGQLGDGGGMSTVTPRFTGTATQPACGQLFGCAIGSGALACWGYNDRGQLGLGTQDFTVHPLTLIANTSQYFKVAAGSRHACAIATPSLNVACWGANDVNQIAGDPLPIEPTPTLIAGVSGVSSLGAGGETTCAADSSTVTCWGRNDLRQLGDGTVIGRATPVTAQASGNMVAVGARFACAVSITGDVRCWGDNDDGQIGSGPQTRSLVPVTVDFP